MKTIRKAFSFVLIAVAASSALGAKLSSSVPKGWGEDFASAKETAEKSGKLILLAFSGSDWCGWCVKMEKEIYSDSKFIKQAKKKFVLVMVDNPRDKSILSPLAQKQNPSLVSEYQIRGYPSTVIVRPSGEEVKRFGGYRRDGVDAFLNALDKVADDAGVKASPEVSDEDAKGDDRFFPNPADKAKIAERESKQRKTNALSTLALDEFAGIAFFSKASDGKPSLKNPYLLLSEVRKTYYSGNKLTGLTLAAPTKDVKEMSDEKLRVETCKLVRAMEEELGVKFAVTGDKIDFKGKKTQIVVRSSKVGGELSVQVAVKR